MSSPPCASAAAWGRRDCSKCYKASQIQRRERSRFMIATIAILVLLLAILLVVTLKSFGINREYERAVLFRLGRLGQTKGPGWFWLIPFVDRIRRVDMRTITYQLETQETITRDGVAVRVNAVL